MGSKNWIIGLIVIIVAVGGFIYWGFNKSTVDRQVAGESTSDSYFSEDAPVMFFYSEKCSWCQKEKTEVLSKLGPLGYKVKPMDVAVSPNLWKDYSISGTPTFIAKNGDKLEGFQTEDVLKKWLDQHK